MIKGKTIALRILERRHLEELRLMRNDPATSTYLTSPLPINELAQEDWFRKMCVDQSRMYFAVELLNGSFVGMVRCDEWDRINRSIRIGVDIVPAHRRKGLATEAYRVLMSYLFGQVGVHRIWLLVAAFNKPAIALYNKMGFRVEGRQRDAIFRDNKFNDYVMMSILRTDGARRLRAAKARC